MIQIFNVGAGRMLGYSAGEVLNTITPADISDSLGVVARAKAPSAELATPITPGFEALVFKAARGTEDTYELTYTRQDGSRLPAAVSVTALRDDQSATIGYLLIVTDIDKPRQVFIDVLGNAVKFTERGGVSVRVSADRLAAGGPTPRVEVTGPGTSRDGQDERSSATPRPAGPVHPPAAASPAPRGRRLRPAPRGGDRRPGERGVPAAVDATPARRHLRGGFGR